MKIIICGAGHVGQSLIHYLYPEYDIIVVDKDPEILEKLHAHYDVQTVIGDASDPEILQNTQMDSHSSLVAVTGSDNTNLVICQIANLFFFPALKALRLSKKAYFKREYQSFLGKTWGLDLIFSPEYSAQSSILKSFEIPYAFDSYSFFNNKIRLIGLQAPCMPSFLGKTMEEIQEFFEEFKGKIVRLIRGYQAWIPAKNDILQSQDALYFIVEEKHSQDLMKKITLSDPRHSQAIFVGASRINAHVIEKLEHWKTILIDEKSAPLNPIATTLKETQILQGNPFSPELLNEANIQKTDYFIAATEDDTTNLLSCLMAHSYGVPHCIAVVQNMGYLSPLFTMGIEKIVRPSQLITAQLLQKLTRTYVETFYPLEGHLSGTVIEAVVQEGSKILHMHAKDFSSEDATILTVLRGGRWLGNLTKLEKNDHVILTVLPSGHERFQKLFEPSTSS